MKKIIILENIKSNELSLVFSKIVSKGLCCDKVWGISIFPFCTPIRGIYRKSLLNLSGLGDIWSAETNTPAIMNYIRQRLLDIEQQTWISEIHNDERKDPHQKNKLRTFRKFKLTHDYENYLTNVRNINHRVAITKLRLSNHKLAIETGRYVKPYQPPDQRICPLCKTGLEDEEHFLMNCIAKLCLCIVDKYEARRENAKNCG